MSFPLIQKISEKTLKFGNIRVNKKEFHRSKQPIDLMSVNINQKVVSGRFKHSDKYFENGGKNLSFMVKDDNVLDKYNKIWDKIKETLNIKFHNKPVYDETYIKVKVREFDSHFTPNNFYPYIFVDFELVILLLIAGHITPFLFMAIFLKEEFLGKPCSRHNFC